MLFRSEALVGVPLLALLIPVEVAVPLAVLLSVTVAGMIVVQDWRQVHVRSAWWLVLSSFLGIPCGLALLTLAEAHLVKGILACVIVAFSGYCLLGRKQLELKSDRLAWGFGLCAGVLGGAYGMNGPPLVVYGILRRWSPAHFRATLQGYFLPASLEPRSRGFAAQRFRPGVDAGCGKNPPPVSPVHGASRRPGLSHRPSRAARLKPHTENPRERGSQPPRCRPTRRQRRACTAPRPTPVERGSAAQAPSRPRKNHLFSVDGKQFPA